MKRGKFAFSNISNNKLNSICISVIKIQVDPVQDSPLSQQKSTWHMLQWPVLPCLSCK